MSEETDEKTVQDYISSPSLEEEPTEVEETEEADQVETPEPDQQEVEEDETSGLSEGLKKRFSKMTADKHRLKSAKEEAERKAAELEAKIQRYETKSPEMPIRPRIDDDEIDYNDEKLDSALDQYYIDLAKWTAKNELAEFEQKDAAKRIQSEQQKREQEYAKKVEAAGIEDYAEKLDSIALAFEKEQVLIPDYLVEAIQTDDNGPKIVEHFFSHPDKAISIAKLGTVQAALEIGRLSAMISNGKPLQKTKAPKPVKPVKGSGAKPKSTDNFTLQDWVHGNLSELGFNDR